MSKRPSKKFRPVKNERIEYKTVSYRLPKRLLEELDQYVNDDTSACSLVSQILRWALDDMKKDKK
jgi:hypothetical protein